MIRCCLLSYWFTPHRIYTEKLSTQEQEHAQLEVDADNFLSALNGGALELCLRYLEHQSAAGRPDPLLNCKLAEALLHRRRCEDALACARRGFLEVGSDPALLGICAWVFSKDRLVLLGSFDHWATVPSPLPHSIRRSLFWTRPRRNTKACGASLMAH